MTVDTRDVQVVDQDALQESRLANLREEPWVTDDSAAHEIIAMLRRVADVVPATVLAVMDGGVALSYCQLYDYGDAAQVEEVHTRISHRRRGLSRRVASRALELAAQHPLVFLVADPADWPRQFYDRLGFEDAGLIPRFLLKLPRR